MSDLDKLQTATGVWADVIFPKSTSISITKHLLEEAKELSEAAYIDEDGIDNIEEEAADCLLLLLHLAYKWGFSLFDTAAEKLVVNQNRAWEKDDNGRGYWKHKPMKEHVTGCEVVYDPQADSLTIYWRDAVPSIAHPIGEMYYMLRVDPVTDTPIGFKIEHLTEFTRRYRRWWRFWR